jgi:hypothetical protein
MLLPSGEGLPVSWFRIHIRTYISLIRPPFKCISSSVADTDPGSGAFLTPGSGIRNRFFPDPGSRIPDPKTIFLRAF